MNRSLTCPDLPALTGQAMRSVSHGTSNEERGMCLRLPVCVFVLVRGRGMGGQRDGEIVFDVNLLLRR